jgi:hypothetical protein
MALGVHSCHALRAPRHPTHACMTHTIATTATDSRASAVPCRWSEQRPARPLRIRSENSDFEWECNSHRPAQRFCSTEFFPTRPKTLGATFASLHGAGRKEPMVFWVPADTQAERSITDGKVFGWERGLLVRTLRTRGGIMGSIIFMIR